MRSPWSRWHRLIRPGLVCSLLFVSVALTAQTDTRLYNVEVVVFTQDHGDLASEYWPVTRPPAIYPRYADIAESGRPAEDVYIRTADGDLQLHEVARQLDRSDRYEVLLHLGWQQPALDGETAPAVAVPIGDDPTPPAADTTEADNGDSMTLGGARPDPGLSGYLRVYVERYLHVEANLRLVDPSLRLNTRRVNLPLFGDDLAPVVFMEASRRMRSGELHYIDHAILGVLVRIDREE